MLSENNRFYTLLLVCYSDANYKPNVDIVTVRGVIAGDSGVVIVDAARSLVIRMS